MELNQGDRPDIFRTKFFEGLDEYPFDFCLIDLPVTLHLTAGAFNLSYLFKIIV